MSDYQGWEVLNPLGEGGQSTVHLVRSPTRVTERKKCLQEIRNALDGDRRAELANAIIRYTRPELSSELGALKVFDKTRTFGAVAAERLRTEVAILRQHRPGLPKLLDANEAEKWIVTEYFPARTLDRSPNRYRGDVASALKAFRHVLETVIPLHKENIVHRDIKPANVFIADDGKLVLGDFGIVYLPDGAARVTFTGERVGPWDYMPQWADTGDRLENVEPNYDVYMLGKLLWCMVSGRLRLPREYHRQPDFDLTKIFPDQPNMHLINRILDKCLVENASDCKVSAGDLLSMVDADLVVIGRGGQLLSPDVPRLCHVCGVGFYRPLAERGNISGGDLILFTPGNPTADRIGVSVSLFVCTNCHNIQWFTGR